MSTDGRAGLPRPAPSRAANGSSERFGRPRDRNGLGPEAREAGGRIVFEGPPGALVSVVTATGLVLAREVERVRWGEGLRRPGRWWTRGRPRRAHGERPGRRLVRVVGRRRIGDGRGEGLAGTAVAERQIAAASSANSAVSPLVFPRASRTSTGVVSHSGS